MKIDRKQIRYSLQLLLHLQKNKVTNSQDGYAMLITSILAILMFSMLSVYLFSANLYKSVANSVVDSGSTFYAAETGMNKRASAMKTTFEGYSQPTGESPAGGTDIATQMGNCINSNRNAAGTIVADDATTIGTGDFRCREIEVNYKESAWKGNGDNRYTEDYSGNPEVKYRAYSFVRKLTEDGEPAISKIPPGEEYAGLNMQEYKYRVYTTAMKRGARESNRADDFSVSAQTLLQMDFNSRVIPLFQFAVFYEPDLEFTNGLDMTLSGPIHSNTNVWFGPGATLTAGQTTAARKKDASDNWIGGKIYKSLDRNNPSSANVGRRVKLGNNPYIDVNAYWNTPNTLMSSTDISTSQGLIAPNQPRLNIPAAGFLDRSGNYYNKADLRVTFDPSNTGENSKFVVQSVQAGVTNTFTSQMVRSLRQPVMLVTTAHDTENKSVNLNTTEWSKFCAVGNKANFTSANITNTLVPSSKLNSFTFAQSISISNALRRAIAKSSTIYKLAELNTKAMNSTELSSLKTLFKIELDAIALAASLSPASITILTDSVTPREIANKSGNCFLPAPMNILSGQRDRQEQRDMTILQSNIHSMIIWNRDGQYSNDGVNVLSAASKVFARKPELSSSLTDSYDWMGLASSDTTERGLVWHFSVKNDGTYPLAYPATRPAAPAVDATVRKSPYGFSFSGGRLLPGPLTIATDQIAYIQGDYNNPGGVQPTTIGNDIFAGASGSVGANNFAQKQPAAVMADAVGVLSNNCVDPNGNPNCFNVANGTSLPVASNTSIHTAFLAGTRLEGGLNNYMRKMEDWRSAIIRYRGSFVCLSEPQKLDGIYRGDAGSTASSTNYYRLPNRDFGYDTSFNSVSGLPPLTPQVVYLKQKVFRRDYNSDRSN
jgi:hypothetical protein